MKLSPSNAKLLAELILRASFSYRTGFSKKAGETFTVFYQTKFGSGYEAAFHRTKLGSGNKHSETPTISLADYTKLTTIRVDDIEDVFRIMQGDVWSPNGEARPIIKELGLRHTSMSVGDLVRKSNGEYLIVAPMGFQKVLVKTDEGSESIDAAIANLVKLALRAAPLLEGQLRLDLEAAIEDVEAWVDGIAEQHMTPSRAGLVGSDGRP